VTAHADLCDEIKDWLTKAGAWFFRPNSHGYGKKGVPDFVACYQGRFVAIEAKVAPDKPKPWQARCIADIQSAGGIAIVVHDVAELGRVFIPKT